MVIPAPPLVFAPIQTSRYILPSRTHGHTMNRIVMLSVAVCSVGCAPPTTLGLATAELPPGVEAISFLGDTLTPPRMNDSVRTAHDERLVAARAAWERDPDNADAIIWLGRRTAYLGRYRDAIRIYTEGVEQHPSDPRFYRHRGHRYLTVREPRRAIEDLEAAARLIHGQPDQVEPDGLPNALNMPRSSLQSNIWYHLGLAYYVVGEYENASRAYRECLAVSTNDDMLVATVYWYYMTLQRVDDEAEARSLLERIEPEMDIIENGAYHRLLLLFKGQLSVEQIAAAPASMEAPLANATIGYGVGRWHAMLGRPSEARMAWRRTLAGTQWAAFGYLAAEAEIARDSGAR